MNNAVTMRPDADASLGTIDQYELIRELGGGGFGCVYLAEDTVSGVKVAVKGLPPLVRNSREELENIRRNFALVLRLTHENIAKALVLHPARQVNYTDGKTAKNLRVAAAVGTDTYLRRRNAESVTARVGSGGCTTAECLTS